MLKSLFERSKVPVITISNEELYNYLYWDHRIYDIRSKEDYEQSHLCRAHNIDSSLTITIDTIANMDKQIDDDYGKSENSSEVIIYTYKNIHDQYQFILEILLSYLSSSKNPSNKLLKQINILTDGYEDFHITYPFLCSDSTDFNRCSQLVWPSYIIKNLYLGSAMCRNETIISQLKITHIMSFSDYPEQKLLLSNIKTCHYQISDSLSADLLSLLPSAISWISKVIDDDKGIVLIHCDQGVSRSVTVVIAYLLNFNGNFSTVTEALKYVKSKRSVIRPNTSFLQQLEEYLIRIRTK